MTGQLSDLSLSLKNQRISSKALPEVQALNTSIDLGM